MKRKPSGYWTYERCKEEVSRYNTKKELYVGNPGSTGGYSKFNIEKCIENVKKCKSITEFRNRYNSEYNYIIKHSLNKDNEVIIILFNNMRNNKSEEYSNKEVCGLNFIQKLNKF